MIFRTDGKEYAGATAEEIVLALAGDAAAFQARTSGVLHEFLTWSLEQLSDRLPPRELEISNRLSNEILARSYLSLRHDYGIGEIIE